MVAAPRIPIERFYDLGPQGVVMNVFEERKEIVVPVAEDGLVPALEEMTDGPVSPVEVHRVALVHTLKDLGQRDCPCLDQEMDVVVHEDVSVKMVHVAGFVTGQQLEVFLEIGRIFEDFLPVIATGNHVVEGSVKLYPWFAGHDGRVAEKQGLVKIDISKSDPILC